MRRALDITRAQSVIAFAIPSAVVAVAIVLMTGMLSARSTEDSRLVTPDDSHTLVANAVQLPGSDGIGNVQL